MWPRLVASDVREVEILRDQIASQIHVPMWTDEELEKGWTRSGPTSSTSWRTSSCSRSTFAYSITSSHVPSGGTAGVAKVAVVVMTKADGDSLIKKLGATPVR